MGQPNPPAGPRFIPQPGETIALIGGTEAVALGRSVYGVLDRNLSAAGLARSIGGTPDLRVALVADATGLPALALLGAAALLLKPGGVIVPLIKPQFEVGRGEVGKGGVVRDPAAHEKAIEGVKAVAGHNGRQASSSHLRAGASCSCGATTAATRA